MLRGLASAAEQLRQPEDWDRALAAVLKQTGLALGVSRVLLCEAGADPDRPTGSEVLRSWPSARWVGAESPAGLDSPVPPAPSPRGHGAARWLHRLRAGEAVTCRLGDLSGQDHARLARRGTQSILLAPVFAGSHWWGYLAAEDCQTERTWTAPETDALRVLAEIVGGAIERRRTHSERAVHEATAIHRRSNLLAEASTALASSLDYEATLQQVAGLAVPSLCDWCTVYMLSEDGHVRRVAVAYDDSRAELAQALRGYPPSPVSPNSSVAEVMRTGMSVLTPKIPQQYVTSIAQDAEHLRIMEALDFRSSMTVPLGARGEVFGALAFFSCDPDQPFTEKDLDLAEDLAHRAGLAVDNARLYREAQQAIRARDEFVSVAAHELKTPLTSMLGFAQVLLGQLGGTRTPDDEIVRRALRAIVQQSDRLSRLVARLLDISRIDSRRLEIDRVSTDLASLVDGVADGARANTRHHEIVVHGPIHLEALVDPMRLEQVLGNLLDNAVKFSPEGSQIDVELAEADGETVRLSVTDRGVGIPPERRAHVFDRFYQAHAGSQIAGLGLGLYISKQMVELHGGSITAEFPEEGGTRFVILLPREPERA